MYLLKVLFKLNLVTCREFIYLFLEKDVEKVGTPQKAYHENHLHIIFYTKTKRNKKIYISYGLYYLYLLKLLKNDIWFSK